MSGVRCQVSGVRCQVSGVRCQVSTGETEGFSVPLICVGHSPVPLVAAEPIIKD